jgi:pimeloyl-[acyl-carrier protein] methyl ester esterase
MRFVLAHGWGFHAGIWDPFVDHLPNAEIARVDLGFVEGGPAGVNDWPEDSIAIGHSLGLLWLLRQGQGRFRALVSIQGFDCFSCHIPKSRVLGMQRTLKRDADATLRAFWKSCGTEPFAAKDALNIEALGNGLDWLASWDAREERAALDCPMLALASGDDAIVPRSMSETIWNGDVIWSETGGHALPLLRPDWCASHVIDFADAIRP